MAEVFLSPGAAARILKLKDNPKLAPPPGARLRLTVSGGGCHGFSYGFAFDAALNPDDHVFSCDGAELVVDEASLGLVAGSTVQYEDSLMGAFFKLENPNAASSCGCGTSFSLA
jgi:iron-sulfur cluster insertion protein